MSQAFLGPSIIEHGVNPETSLIGFSAGGMAMLGPARGPSDEVEPIDNFFIVLGKLISARRSVDPLLPGAAIGHVPAEHPIQRYGVLQDTVLGYSRDAAFDIVWQPLAQKITTDVLDPLRHQTADLDYRTRRFVAAETHAVLAIDPTATVEERMAALQSYLLRRGYTVEAKSGGFRDFIASSFSGPDGERISLPDSSDPSFPDAWITPDLVSPMTPGGSRRTWSIVW